MRRESRTGHLRRLGFTNPGKARQLVDHRDDLDPVVEALGESADPDQGLLIMLRLADADPTTFASLMDNPSDLAAVTRIAGLSTALGDMLISHPEWMDGLGEEPATDRFLGRSQGAATIDPRTCWDGAVAQLRYSYHRELLAIAAWDLTASNPVDHFAEVSAKISDLVAATLQGALALARSAVHNSDAVDIAIIAMGKSGGRELNYISDVDVVYVGEPVGSDEAEALEIATKVVTAVSRAVSAPGAAPPLWPLDANLRPEGKDGPLVRTLDSHVAYYERWAHDWEFQALLKARPIAGDEALGDAYITAIEPFIWSASGRDQFVETTRQMRARVESTIANRDPARQIKLGAGGLRDVEFTVQILQLVHGRVDTSLRARSTLDGLAALRDNGYVARTDADKLDRHYRFLRTLEHRIQLQKMRRSQVLPTNPIQLRRIGRAMRIDGITSAAELESTWARVRSEVRDLHRAIYYRPLLPEAARLSDDDISLDAGPARDRLAGIGYRDPGRAIAHITALTDGVSRTAMIQRQLLPVLLGWFADGPEPDSALLHFRILSETMGKTHWYMTLLRDSSTAARRLAHVLSTSQYLAEAIPTLPESVRWLEGDSELLPRDRQSLVGELDALTARRHTGRDKAIAGRYLRRRSLLRTGLGLVLGAIDTPTAQRAITVAAEVAIEAALRGATEQVLSEHGLAEAPSTYLIVGLGSFGAADMSFGSDCDLLFVHRARTDDHAFAQKIAAEIASALLVLLSEGSKEPALKVDADLRPEGRHGPLVRSLDSYAEYYDRWMATWERQALLRARPVAGDEALGQQFTDLINPIRYGARLTAGEDRDVRRMKARVETERAPRAAVKTRHLKLGPGGIADVEWAVQYLQLQHGGDWPSLRTASTIAVLDAAVAAGLLSIGDADKLSQAWLYAQQVRLATALATGRTSGPRVDTIPTDSSERATVAALLSKDLSGRDEVEENYLRLARRARSVVETMFFGDDGKKNRGATQRR